jgi:hypothetical protein
MTKSESIIKIAPALLKAQKQIGAAKKDAANPFFKSKYADLGSIMEVCKYPLNENGITVLQPISSDDNGVYVSTMLLHESGEYIESSMRISAKSPNDPQAQGSAISYAKRYSLQSMVFIPAEDDDGNRASRNQGEGNQSYQRQTPPKSSPAQSEGQSSEQSYTTVCQTCGKPASEKKGTTKGGKSYHGIFCSTEDKSHTRWLYDTTPEALPSPSTDRYSNGMCKNCHAPMGKPHTKLCPHYEKAA